MGAVNGQTGGGNDPNAILNECREVNRGIDELERDGQSLKNMSQEVDKLLSPEEEKNFTLRLRDANYKIQQLNTRLIERMKKVKADPASGHPRNEKQVGATSRRLKGAYNKYQQADAEVRKELGEKRKRAYLTIEPNATEPELQRVAEDSSMNMYSTAVSIPCCP